MSALDGVRIDLPARRGVISELLSPHAPRSLLRMHGNAGVRDPGFIKLLALWYEVLVPPPTDGAGSSRWETLGDGLPDSLQVYGRERGNMNVREHERFRVTLSLVFGVVELAFG